MIERLANDCPVSLAVSLHAGNNSLRDKLVPVNKKYPLLELMEACKKFQERSPREFITFEIVMLKDVNDSKEHANQIVKLVSKFGIRSKFNLIPFNCFGGMRFKTSKDSVIQEFKNILHSGGYTVTVRKTRGKEISAACGQLAGEVVNKVKFNGELSPS